MDCPNKNVRVEYTFSDEEGKRTTPFAMGKKFDPKFGERHTFTISKVTERDLIYLCKDAICFEVWGEIDDVEEADVAEAVAMELPPETFEFFLAHDFRLADSMPCARSRPTLGPTSLQGTSSRRRQPIGCYFRARRPTSTSRCVTSAAFALATSATRVAR